ncbi:MAG TPA: polysaccharide deacetylase family protein [Gaiellaceae bacterium]|nr:polysaccharide deacetylase family protein [Gaiellaceae bacterium]
MSDRPRLALTFDDGPSEWTVPILELLSHHAALATFFVIGGAVAGREHVLQRVSSEGHEVGNHTWSHPRLASECDDVRVREELEKTSALVHRLTGEIPSRFRAPYYDVDDRVLRVASRLGLAHTRGDITPPDWDERCSATLIATLVLSQVRPGAIVGLHDGDPSSMASRARTLDALKVVLPRLVEDGFELVTVSQLESAYARKRSASSRGL